MTHPACAAARRALVAGDPASAHICACAACRAFEARLGRVDGALEAAACDAGGAALPPALRARIVAAMRATAPPPPAVTPRARLLDLLLRTAAVAAVLLAGASLLPTDVLAAESGDVPLRLPEWGVGESFVSRLAEPPRLPPAAPVEIPGGLLPLACAAGLLLAGAFTLSVQRRPA